MSWKLDPIDTDAPVVHTNSEGFDLPSNQTISGQLTPWTPGLMVFVFDGTVNVGSAVTVQADGTWSTDITLVGDGSHTISAITCHGRHRKCRE